MAYADGFVIPVPKKNIAAYRRLALKASKVWKEHGALDYYECVGDDLTVPAQFTGFAQLARNLDIGHKTRRTRADDDAGREVANQRRHLQPRSDETQYQR